MLLWVAHSIGTAWQRRTRVHALVIGASELARAFVVLRAFGLDLAHAPDDIGIASGAAGTLAFVRTSFVDTKGVVSARVVPAFIDVFTTGQRISSETGLA